MKVLWLCNVVLPSIAKQMNVTAPFGGGWLVGALNGLQKYENVELAVCFPFRYDTKGATEQMRYYTFARSNEATTVERFSKIIREFSPDIIHVFGTEYRHSLNMVEACEQCHVLDRVIISIQGLVSVCAKHYFAGLPSKVTHSCTIRDFFKGSNIYRGQKTFEKNGMFEIKAIQKVKHLIGRTEWDQACTYQINPQANYYSCCEILRPAFYDKAWNNQSCEKHSIFVSQCNYPLKGMHRMIEAMAEIVKHYPDAKLYTTGNHPLKLTLNQKVRQNYYSKYLGKLIQKYSLENHVEFLGALDEEAMCRRYLKSNVFVCCSSIENSPNSVGEAMMLGVPVVASDVGGVTSMLRHEIEGFVYPADAPYMLAHYVMKLFADEALQNVFSQNAKKRAKNTHSMQLNTEALMNVYNQVISKSEHKE